MEDDFIWIVRCSKHIYEVDDRGTQTLLKIFFIWFTLMIF